jgi:hypothetical protein
MPRSKAEFKFYDVIRDRGVTLRITVGHAQVGATQASINQRPLVSEDITKDRIKAAGRSEWVLPLGAGAVLDGQLLVATTVVADVRAETDETQVNYELTGGVQDFKFSLQESVDQPGGIVVYTLTVDFIAAQG